MIQLAANERVIFVIRRHWFGYVRPILALVGLSVLPAAGWTAVSLRGFAPPPELVPVIQLLLVLYVKGLLTYTFINWMTYYLDAWIITDQRLIDIEQVGLFHRRIAEIALERIQNVGLEIPGVIPTFLDFGNLKIQTAGEGEFTIHEVPHLIRAKEFILQYSRQAHRARAAKLPSPDGTQGL